MAHPKHRGGILPRAFVVAVLLTLPVPGLAQEGASPAPGPDDAAFADALEEIRAATARYADPEAALADGYVPDPMNLCISAEVEGLPRQLGGMGVHYFRPDLLGLTGTEPRVAGNGTHTDFLTPSVLVYVPGPDGKLRLGGVENLVFADAWKAEGKAEPPSFHGHDYWRLTDNPATPDLDEAHMFEPHYELHLWVHMENPMGVSFPFNPAVSCEGHDGPRTMEEGMEYMKAHPPPAPGSR